MGRIVVERYETQSVVVVALDRTLLTRSVKVDGTDVLGDLDGGQLEQWRKTS